MIFCNGGNEEFYISSADLMTRNIEHRIEVTCPVFDKTIRNELKKIFDILWHDNVKARKIDAELSNKFVKPGNIPLQAQVEVYNFLKKVKSKCIMNYVALSIGTMVIMIFSWYFSIREKRYHGFAQVLFI